MIIDNNFLTSDELKVVKEGIIDNINFPWFRVPHSTSIDYPFYSHTLIKRKEFIDQDESEINSTWTNFFFPILEPMFL